MNKIAKTAKVLFQMDCVGNYTNVRYFNAESHSRLYLQLNSKLKFILISKDSLDRPHNSLFIIAKKLFKYVTNKQILIFEGYHF